MQSTASTVAVVLSLGLLAYAIVGRTASAEESGSALLLVANKGDQTLSIVDPPSGKQIAAVPVGGTTGHEVAVSPDGKTAWVPIYGNSGVGQPGTDGQTISVIDLPSHKLVGQIELKQPSRPHCAVFGPKDGRLYVTTELTQSIQVIDPAARKIVDAIPTGAAESHMMTISPDGKRAYTANVGAGTVSVIDLQARKVIKVIPVAKVVQRIAMSTDGRWIFTADQTKPQVAVIDTETNTVSKWIPLPSLGYGMAVTSDGASLLVAHPGANSVSIVQLHTMKVEKTIPVPASPQEILAPSGTDVAYVSCDKSRQVAVLNLSTKKVEKLIDVGAGADGLAWAR